jgi:hypothetical protein
MPIRALFLRIVVGESEAMRRFVLMPASCSIEREKAGVVRTTGENYSVSVVSVSEDMLCFSKVCHVRI